MSRPAFKPLKRKHLEQIRQLVSHTDTLYHGIITMKHIPQLLTSTQPAPAEKRQYEQWSRSAQDLLSTDGSYIFESSTISLYAFFETFILDYCHEILREGAVLEKAAQRLSYLGPNLTKSKIVYEALLAGRGYDGLKRLNAALDYFGLKLDLPERQTDAFFEFTVIRNFLCHSDRVADNKLFLKCPRFTVGREVRISSEDFLAYKDSVIEIVNKLPAE